MREDPGLGDLARRLRHSQGMTLATAARRAGCSPSLLSQVESGTRQMHPWLASALDDTYKSGEALTTLAASSHANGTGQAILHSPGLVLVQLPRRGLTVAVSRRELLASLSIGTASGTLLAALDRTRPSTRADTEMLSELDNTARALQTAGRAFLPSRLTEPLTGQIALIDAIRRRAPAPLASDYMTLQIRCAESLSWMAEESGDVHEALYWVDRVQQWASAAGWQAMTAYGHVRRSMLAISHTSDAMTAVDQAMIAFRASRSPARVRGLAAKQIAFGHALAGQADESRRALDQAVRLLSDPTPSDDAELPAVGQLSVATTDLLVLYRATCDVYLGGGTRVITALTPLIKAIGAASPRTQVITEAKLAQAYAHAGEPAIACELAMRAATTATAVGSASARAELRRVLPALARWPGRDDVTAVRNQLAVLG